MRVSGVPYEVNMDDYTMEFEFIYKGAPDRHGTTISDTLHKKLVVSDCANFHDIHEAFLDFLSAAYGYDVKPTLMGTKDEPNTFTDS